MYNFIDVTETPEGASLPSEALKINGEYIENLITGYRTLTVEGREALSPELATFETGIRDGSEMKGKRYPARTIRVTYQLRCGSNEEFRAAYNKLGAILDVEDAELIFDDEPDKFFVGTPAFIGEVTPGRNAVIGEFEILCLDPFKYSVAEYEAAAEPGESSIILDYGGTYKSFPKLSAEFFKETEASEDGETVTELTGSGDCGYVAFFTEDEKIIQLGDPDEADLDTDAYPKSQTLVNQDFNSSKAWGSAAKSQWATNSGITSSNAVVQTGSVAVGIATHETTGTPKRKTETILSATSTAEKPYVDYQIEATASNRTETSADVTITVKSSLSSASSYFGKGYCLKAAVGINGETKTLTLKESNYRWEGTTVHYKVFTVKVDCSAAQKTLSGITFKAYRDDSTGGQTGVLSQRSCANFTIPAYTVPTAETWYLRPTSYGTGTDWHGPSITRTIPADAAGEVGAANFKLSYSQKMSIGTGEDATKQYGAFQVLAVSGSGDSRKIVAGVNVYKGSTGKTAKLRFYVNNAVVETTDIDLSAANKYFYFNRTSTITKSGKTVHFSIGNGNIQRQYSAEAISDVPVTEITFTFTKFGDKPALEKNGLYSAKFVKDYCTTWKDVPNKFSASDVVEADCRTGEVLLNGADMPALGALGNDWEGFYLSPGLNQIGISYSDWVAAEYAPTMKVKYREVFL